MAWKVEGNGTNFTFPNTFELEGYSRSENLVGLVIQGRDGERVDNRMRRRNPLQLMLTGITNDDSLADARDTFNEIVNAVHGLPDEFYLVNTVDDIRIPVHIRDFRHLRMPAKMQRFSLNLVAFAPFWESRNVSEVEFSSAKIVDCPIGNAPVYPNLIFEGAASNMTVVQGNWSFCSHVYDKKANAVTEGASTDPYSEITGLYSGTEDIKITQRNFGLNLTSTDTFSFSSIYQRHNKLSFNYKLEPGWANNSNATHQLFDFEQDGASDHWELFASNGRLIFGSDSTFGGNMSSFATSDNVEFAGWYDADGTIIDGTTYYGKLFQDGAEIASTTATLAGCASIIDTLHLGTNTLAQYTLNAVIDEVYFFNQNMGDNWCKSETVSGRTLESDNKVFKWASTLDANDFLKIDMEKLTVLKIDESTQSTSNEIAHVSGDFFRLSEGTGRSGQNENKMDTLIFGNSYSGAVQYRKLYW